MVLNLSAHAFLRRVSISATLCFEWQRGTRRFRDSSSSVGNTLFSLAPWTTAMILALWERARLTGGVTGKQFVFHGICCRYGLRFDAANRSTYFRDNHDDHLAFLDTLFFIILPRHYSTVYFKQRPMWGHEIKGRAGLCSICVRDSRYWNKLSDGWRLLIGINESRPCRGLHLSA